MCVGPRLASHLSDCKPGPRASPCLTPDTPQYRSENYFEQTIERDPPASAKERNAQAELASFRSVHKNCGRVVRNHVDRSSRLRLGRNARNVLKNWAMLREASQRDRNVFNFVQVRKSWELSDRKTFNGH